MNPTASVAFGPGYYGKLPIRNDLLEQALPDSFLEPWEEWLHGFWENGIERFGDVWSPLVAQSPIWRFVLEEDVCGPDAVAGLLAPSADRDGQVFLFCLAAAVPSRTDPAMLPVTASAWYGQAEALLRQARCDPALNLAAFESKLQALGPPRRTPSPTLPGDSYGWHVALDPIQAPALAYPALIHDLAATLPDRFSLWWSLGTRRVGPSLVVCTGLPHQDAVTAFFDGAWDYWGWGDGDGVFDEE